MSKKIPKNIRNLVPFFIFISPLRYNFLGITSSMLGKIIFNPNETIRPDNKLKIIYPVKSRITVLEENSVTSPRIKVTRIKAVYVTLSIFCILIFESMFFRAKTHITQKLYMTAGIKMMYGTGPEDRDFLPENKLSAHRS